MTVLATDTVGKGYLGREMTGTEVRVPSTLEPYRRSLSLVPSCCPTTYELCLDGLHRISCWHHPLYPLPPPAYPPTHLLTYPPHQPIWMDTLGWQQLTLAAGTAAALYKGVDVTFGVGAMSAVWLTSMIKSLVSGNFKTLGVSIIHAHHTTPQHTAQHSTHASPHSTWHMRGTHHGTPHTPHIPGVQHDALLRLDGDFHGPHLLRALLRPSD